MSPPTRVSILLTIFLSITPRAPGLGQTPPTPAVPGISRALFIVGLPGDREHESLFRVTVKAWRKWLVNSLKFPPSEVRILAGQVADPGFSDGPSTRESISCEIDLLRKKTKPEDRVWVFVLAHVNVDDGHAFLHLLGPDVSNEQFSGLFRGLVAHEQVFWMTSAGSGMFLPTLSAVGRIVIAATERDGELNETEFPHALAEITSKPFDQLDLDHDGKISIREIFEITVVSVEAKFAKDGRAPTEHPQLDDDGDGIGTEHKPREKSIKPDGSLASKTFLPWIEPEKPSKPPTRSENGTNRVDSPTR